LILGIAGFTSSQQASGQAAMTALFDGSNLSAFNPVGDANWQIVEGAVQANMGTGFLVTKASYGDFQFTAEIWVDDDANSGVFIRCANPKEIGANNSYEVNVFDKRPDQSYRTGAIVNFAKPTAMVNTAGKWNTIEITAQKARLIVTINGTRTADVENTMYASGPIALQRGAGVVKFRNVRIRPL
jgi:hypothetical protein